MVPGSSPLRPCPWLVTGVVSNGVVEPYAVVVPYSTCEVAGWFVVQVIVAAELVIFDEFTFEITTLARVDVVNVKSPLTTSTPLVPLECTR
jgi:hypothetical protein